MIDGVFRHAATDDTRSGTMSVLFNGNLLHKESREDALSPTKMKHVLAWRIDRSSQRRETACLFVLSEHVILISSLKHLCVFFFFLRLNSNCIRVCHVVVFCLAKNFICENRSLRLICHWNNLKMSTLTSETNMSKLVKKDFIYRLLRDHVPQSYPSLWV